MRSFIKLTKLESEGLAKRFPELLDLINYREVDSLDQYALSAFDHWLSPEETRTQIGNAVSEDQENLHNQKFQRFLSDISAETEVFLIKLKGRRRLTLTFRRFLSRDALRKLFEHKNRCGNDFVFR
jgi:hypothetical protein